MECFSKPFLQEKVHMLHISNSIAVHVLQIPNDQNGKNAIVYATLVIPDGRVVVPYLLVLLLKRKIPLK